MFAMQSSVCIFAFTLLVSLSSAQFPRSCTDTQSLAARECCPAGNDDSKCGESSNRGSCLSISPAATRLSTNETARLLLDDRARWPTAFYDRLCICNGNFDGIECSKCKAGYEGDTCNTRSTLLVRRNFTSMPTNGVKKFVEILNRSKMTTSPNYVILTSSFDRFLKGEAPIFKNVSVYDVFVWMHYYASRDNLVLQDEDLKTVMQRPDVSLENRFQLVEGLLNENTRFEIETDVDYAHEGSAFLPWHRYYMLKWEEEIREVVAQDSSFTLPYWDWRDNDNCDVCNDVMLGGRSAVNETLLSEGSPFSKWEVICTRGSSYIEQGDQCTGEKEGAILRNPGNYDPQQITGLPTSDEVDNALILADEYDTPGFDLHANRSYRNFMEGFANTQTGDADPSMSYMHNSVHLYMNGTMSSVDSSANDPIFVLHHAYVDSLYEMWLQQKQEQQRLNIRDLFDVTDGPSLGHRPQDFMVPFFPLVRNREGFARSAQLGYVYDYLSDVTQENSSDDTTDGSGINIEQITSDASTGVTDDVSSDTMNVIARLDVPQPILNKKSQIARFKVSQRRKSKVKRRFSSLSGEGGFSLDANMGRVVAVMGETQLLTNQDRGANLQADVSSSSDSLWQRFQNAIATLNRAFKTMTRSDVALLIVVCLLFIGCSCLCICMCRSRPTSPRKKQCCCYGYKGEPEEEFALLECDNSSKNKIVKGKLYIEN